MIATQLISTSRSAKSASRRSISPPPQNAKQLNRLGTVQRPLRWNPDRTATPLVDDPSPPTIRPAQLPSATGSLVNDTGRGAAVPLAGRSRVIGVSSAYVRALYVASR